jgi:hypothetical protein
VNTVMSDRNLARKVPLVLAGLATQCIVLQIVIGTVCPPAIRAQSPQGAV